MVDDARDPARSAWLAGQRDVTVVRAPRDAGGPAALSAGVDASTGEVVVLLRDDVVVGRFWADGLLRALSTAGAGAVGPVLAGRPGPQGATGVTYDSPATLRDAADAWRRSRTGQTEAARVLDAACVALPARVLSEVGGLDGSYRGTALAVADLCLRLEQAGHALAVAADVLVHAEPVAVPAQDPEHHVRLWSAAPLLSAALIVKDEQRALPRCLASLRGVVDELVVCDTGSSDRTVEVAEAFGARVVHAPWTGDFAAARNVALAACRGTWVLSVDADEQLGVAPGTDLRLHLLALPTDAGSVTVRSRSDEQGGATFEHQGGRLFRRGPLSWVGAVHETLLDARTGAAPRYTEAPGVWLDHDGYVGRVYDERDKTRRNLLLAEKDHAQAVEAGDDGRRWKTAYELARALSRSDEAPARTEALLREALVLMPPGLAHLRADAHVRLATAVARQGRLTEAVAAARDALVVTPGDPAALLVLGEALAADGRAAEALAALDEHAHAGQDGVEAVLDLGKRDVDLPQLRARLLSRLGRPDDAVPLLLQVADAHLGALDWGLLASVLDGVAGGDRTLAQVVARAPEQALAALDGLPAARTTTLVAHLADLGVDAHAASPAARRAARLDEALLGHDSGAVVEAALALEDSDLAAALELWSRVPDSAGARVAQARCLLQLDRVDDAVGALDGVDVDALEPAELLVVVAVAGAAGDRTTAQALVDTLQDRTDQDDPGLRTTLQGLVTTLGLALPDRVKR